MDFYGDINLNDNEMQQMVMQLETNFPTTPTVGRMVFKAGRLFICIAINSGLPVWIPLTNEISTYTHTQVSSSASWSIAHNLETNTPIVQAYDVSTGKQVIADEMTVVDSNNVTVSFGSAIAGRATVVHGNITGTAKPAIAYEHFQTSSSSTWVIPHSLGYEPIVRIFVGNQEVQPDSIVHDTVNQVTITFSTPQVGNARLI